MFIARLGYSVTDFNTSSLIVVVNDCMQETLCKGILKVFSKPIESPLKGVGQFFSHLESEKV